jgi:hypothetical protein
VTRSYRRRPTASNRVLAQTFDLVGATALGGLNALGRFVKKLGVDRELRERFRDVKAPGELRLVRAASASVSSSSYYFRQLAVQLVHCTSTLPDEPSAADVERVLRASQPAVRGVDPGC